MRLWNIVRCHMEYYHCDVLTMSLREKKAFMCNGDSRHPLIPHLGYWGVWESSQSGPDTTWTVKSTFSRKVKKKYFLRSWHHIDNCGLCPRKTWDYVGNWKPRSHWKFKNFADKMSVQHVPKSGNIHIFNKFLSNYCKHLKLLKYRDEMPNQQRSRHYNISKYYYNIIIIL